LQGVLAQAKDVDELFWEEKFHAANMKVQMCTQGALLFLFFPQLGRGGFFFHFFLVPNVFPLCALQVPNGFPSGFQYVPQVPNVFPNMFSIAPHFYPICFGKCCPRFTYIGGPKGMNSTLQNRTLYFGEPP